MKLGQGRSRRTRRKRRKQGTRSTAAKVLREKDLGRRARVRALRAKQGLLIKRLKGELLAETTPKRVYFYSTRSVVRTPAKVPHRRKRVALPRKPVPVYTRVTQDIYNFFFILRRTGTGKYLLTTLPHIFIHVKISLRRVILYRSGRSKAGDARFTLLWQTKARNERILYTARRTAGRVRQTVSSVSAMNSTYRTVRYSYLQADAVGRVHGNAYFQ